MEDHFTPPLVEVPTYNEFFAIKLEGNIVSVPFLTKGEAERELERLTESEKIAADVVTVDVNGNELLLG